MSDTSAPNGTIGGGATVLDQPWQIHLARLQATKGRLKLEIKGITFGGRGILTILREQGITIARTKKRALIDLEAHISDVEVQYGLKCTVCREDRPTQGVQGESGQRLLNVCDRDECVTRALDDVELWDQPNG